MKPICVALPALLLACSAGMSAQFTPGGNNNQSLGDIAKKAREKSLSTVRVSPDEARDLMASVDGIMDFSAKETGLPKVVNVKRQMLTRADLKTRVDEEFAEEVNAQRIEESDVVLKKFGFLPPDFSLSKIMREQSADSLGAFYDPKDKTMYLLNWISLEEQKPIIAHELTHAIQDQAYNLTHFAKYGKVDNSKPTMSVPAGMSDEMVMARRAVVEGGAMIPYLDYIYRPQNVSLVDNIGPAEVVRNTIKNYEPSVSMHDVPRLLRETAAFPYMNGFEFELDLLQKGGRQMAFGSVFQNPPTTTHEIFESSNYFDKKKVSRSSMPDLTPILGEKWEAYDSGHIGELDAQSFVKQYGRENDVYTVARQWDGGSYVAVRKKGHEAGKAPTTADLALVYVSHWGTYKAAKRMAELYMASLPKRTRVNEAGEVNEKDCGYGRACSGLQWSQKAQTAEGTVIAEVYDNNTLFISHSFDDATTDQLRKHLLTAQKSEMREDDGELELSMKLMQIPAFRRMSEAFGANLARQIDAALAAQKN